MTETVVDEERYMHLVPAALREVAVLVEPLTIAEKAITGRYPVEAYRDLLLGPARGVKNVLTFA
jgi:hypothetical protein